MLLRGETMLRVIPDLTEPRSLAIVFLSAPVSHPFAAIFLKFFGAYRPRCDFVRIDDQIVCNIFRTGQAPGPVEIWSVNLPDAR
jgi:hypothetical protein